MRALALAAVAAVCCFISTGCATVMTGAGPNQTLKIASNPRGARIFVDGDYKGVTPLGVAMTRADNHHLRLEMGGYEPIDREIKTGYNPWHLGNIVLGGLIGATVDLVDGSFLWLGGGINQRMARISGPTIDSSDSTALASSRTKRSRGNKVKAPPAYAGPAPSRAPVAAPAAPGYANASDGGYTPTRLPPRRPAPPAEPR